MSTPLHSAFAGGGGTRTDMLNFELLGPGLDLPSVIDPMTVSLPGLPRGFKLERIFLTNYDFEHSWWSPLTIHFRLHDKYGADFVNAFTSFNQGVTELSSQVLLPQSNVLQSSFYYSASGSPYTDYAQGLILWLRGTWVN